MTWFKLESHEKISLENTLFSGQIFSFKRTGLCEYSGVFRGSLITFQQDGDAIYYKFHKNIQEELSSFFTLDINYQELIRKWNSTQSHVKFEYTGLRLLRCELIETIFSFICSSNNNVKRITGMVDYLFTKGDFLGKVGNFSFYKFPSIQKLINIESELRKMKFGFRANYICSAAKSLLNISLDKNMSYEMSKAILMSIAGIGQKVSDCICLISLDHFHVVPIDTHVFNVSKNMFKLPPRLDSKTYAYIKQKYLDIFRNYAGIAQLFIFKESLDRQPNRKKSITKKTLYGS